MAEWLDIILKARAYRPSWRLAGDLPPVPAETRPGWWCRCGPCPGYAEGRSAAGSSASCTQTAPWRGRPCPARASRSLSWSRRDVTCCRTYRREVAASVFAPVDLRSRCQQTHPEKKPKNPKGMLAVWPLFNPLVADSVLTFKSISSRDESETAMDCNTANAPSVVIGLLPTYSRSSRIT